MIRNSKAEISPNSQRDSNDYSWVSVVRTPPFGAALRGEIGRSLPFHEDAAIEYLRGYIRPHLALQSSGIVNVIAPAIDFFPVTFFGVSLGGDYIHRNDPILGLDCNTYECDGWLNSSYLRLSLAYKFRNFFTVGKLERRSYEERTDTSKNLIDSANLFSIAPTNDRGSLTSLVMGWKLEGNHLFGFQFQNQTTEVSKGFQNQQFLFYSIKPADYSYLFSLGRFESDIYQPTPQIAFAINWATANRPIL